MKNANDISKQNVEADVTAEVKNDENTSWWSYVPFQDVFSHNTVAKTAATSALIGGKVGYVVGTVYAPEIAKHARDEAEKFVQAEGAKFFDTYGENIPSATRDMVIQPQVTALAVATGREVYDGVVENLPRQSALAAAAAAAGTTVVAMEAVNVLGWLYNNTIKSSVDAYLQSCEDAKADVLIAEYVRLKKERLEMNNESEVFGFTLVDNVNTLSSGENSAIDMLRNSTMQAGL
jgi:hypothetical protein